MKHPSMSLAAVGALLLAGCASVPTGPSILALPGTGKTFEQFRVDDAQCRDFAQVQLGGTTQEAANNAQVRSAAVGTAIGAVAGAAMGGHEGAGVGAGTGLLFGSVAGADSGYGSGYDAQTRYDNAYVQCMYASGDKVPVSASFVQSHPASSGQPPANYPPPPSGYAPPPR